MWENTVVGSTYRLCFSDDYYQDDWYQPAVPARRRVRRRRDTSFDDAATFTVTEETRRQERTVTLPVVGQLPASGRAVRHRVPRRRRHADRRDRHVEARRGRADLPVGHLGRRRRGSSCRTAPRPTFTPTADLVGKTLFVEVTGTLAGYRTATMQAWAGDVGAAQPTLSQPLAISRHRHRGPDAHRDVRHDHPGRPVPDVPVARRRLRGARAPAREKTFTLTADHVGKRITARMSTGSGGGVLHVSATSAVVQSGVAAHVARPDDHRKDHGRAGAHRRPRHVGTCPGHAEVPVVPRRHQDQRRHGRHLHA